MVNIVNASASCGSKESSVAVLPSKSGSTQKQADNIKVVVRVRPFNEKEIQQNNRIVVDVVDDKLLVFDPKEQMQPFFYQGVRQSNKNHLKRANKELKFVFDHICGQNATNQDVFETTTKDILASLMEGYNCSVFAYGATGAGKTYTMIGSQEDPGITYLTMDHLFDIMNSFQTEREFDIGVSYIEVYNENVYDLLKPSKSPLQLREDSTYGVIIAGLTLNKIKTARELLNMLENGNKNRTQHPTDANAQSSRSHAVFQVYVKMRFKASSQLRLVKLSMIDLAGSERASATGCQGDRFKEGANINRSLLSLGNCINNLADGNNYIPYRDSKLTRLLKDSLGGNCKTVMIANVSPSGASYEDTYNTLKYAARANKIKLSVKKNIVEGATRVSQYVKIIEELKNKVKELEAKQAVAGTRPVPALPVNTQPNVNENEWSRRILKLEAAREELEGSLLRLMSRQRVLSLRQRLRTRAMKYVTDLVQPNSSTDDMDQMCSEELPRKERAVKNYLKESECLNLKVSMIWTKWNGVNKQLLSICAQAVAECPGLKYFVEYIIEKTKMRLLLAKSDLRYKLLTIQSKEIESLAICVTEMPAMLNQLFAILKGYEKVTPTMTAQYMDIMKKAKLSNGVSWSDKHCENLAHIKFISTLDLEKPSTSIDQVITSDIGEKAIDILTDSDDSMDDNMELSVEIRSATADRTPIKLVNNETIVLNDSLESLDTTRNLNSAKKLKRKYDASSDVENFNGIDTKDLNSTFVMAGKVEPLKKQPFKMEVKSEDNILPTSGGLADRTNTIQRTISFNDKAKIVKPLVGKAMPFRRILSTVGPPVAPTPRATGFGSSLSRDGRPLFRNQQEMNCRNRTNEIQRSVGLKAVRATSRVQSHPYTRPGAAYSRK